MTAACQLHYCSGDECAVFLFLVVFGVGTRVLHKVGESFEFSFAVVGDRYLHGVDRLIADGTDRLKFKHALHLRVVAGHLAGRV